MPSIIPDAGALERRLAGLPVVKHQAREVVFSDGSQTGKLLFLRSGAVEIVKDGVQVANVSAPGSVFGEQAALLDQPHTADVKLWRNLSSMSPTHQQYLLVIRPSPCMSLRSLRDDSRRQSVAYRG